MKKLKRVIAGFLILSALVALAACGPRRFFESFSPQYRAQEDCGFVQNVYGERISWQSNVPVKFQLHRSMVVYQSVVQDAMAAWEIASGRKLFELQTEVIDGPMLPRQDSKNVLYLMDAWEANKPSEQGRTTVYWIGDQIYEADIRINAANFKFFLDVPQFASDVHLLSLLIHEFGHVLGLKHHDGDRSVMATYLASSTQRDELSSVDIRDLRCEY